VDAWAEGTPFDPGQHPMYFRYTVQVCEPELAGRIVVHNDEWPLSDAGFSTPGTQAGQFALNVANFLTGGVPGRFLFFSTNFGLTGAALSNTLTGAGHTVVVSTSEPFTLENLQTFDAVFLAGNAPAVASVLTDYVNAGGNVYLASGTITFGTAAAEAAFWNPFLNNFGLSLASVWNTIVGVVPIASADPLFAGVTGLYQDRGNSITDLAPGDPRSRIILTFGSQGLVAVFSDAGGERVWR
jgi:hypothetical protein